jgi:hypothetical protein
MFGCGTLTIMTLDVDKITALTLLSLFIALKFSFRIVGFKMFPLYNFALESPKRFSYGTSVKIIECLLFFLKGNIFACEVMRWLLKRVNMLL